MRSIHYDNEFGLEFPREIQIRRILRVIQQELTPKQQTYLSAYYFEEQTPSQIARRFGVHRSTVLRTLQRAEDRIRRHLIY